MTDHELNSSAQIVQDAILARGLSSTVIEMPLTTRTANEAAQAIGCSVSQIAKSLVFRTTSTGRPILVIASGAHRVNEKKLSQAVGETLERADADFVRSQTGFAIGGVPPLGHCEAIPTFLDLALQEHEKIWAAAGTPFAVFELSPPELQMVTDGRWVSVE